ncbi:MAG: hypothetical protein FWF76_01510 [Oscillospiraceae bacterium]|nr:hypothetical protein [Oscillospiraceae bacterium]
MNRNKSFKRAGLALLLLIVIVFSFSGCVIVGFGNHRPIRHGVGEIRAFDYEIDSFTRLNVYGDFNIVIYNTGEAGEFSLEIEMESNLARYVNVDVSDDALTLTGIGLRNGDDRRLRANLTIPEKHIILSKSSNRGWSNIRYHSEVEYCDDCGVDTWIGCSCSGNHPSWGWEHGVDECCCDRWNDDICIYCGFHESDIVFCRHCWYDEEDENDAVEEVY